MTARRVAVVTRRFWPLVGQAEIAAADLAVALRDDGHQPIVLTAQWHKSWPRQFHYENIPVVRIVQPSLRVWGDWRYMRGVTHWLRDNQRNLDVVLIYGMRFDAVAAVGALGKSSTPVVLLAQSDDPNWLAGARLGGLIRRSCRRADAIVAPEVETRDALIAAGFPAASLHLISPGVPLPPPTRSDARRDARRALAIAWGGSHTSPLTPVALYVGPMEVDAGLLGLFAAWKPIVAHWPEAQLWLVGDGTGRAAIYDRIEQLQLSGRILMPGVAESFDDLLAAADVLVAPADDPQGSHYLLMAMAAGLPVVASDTPQHRRVLTNNECGLLYLSDEADEARALMERLFKQPSLASILGANGRKRIEERFSIQRQLDDLSALFDQLIASKANG